MVPGGGDSQIVVGEGGWTGSLEPAHPFLAAGGVSVPQVLVRVDNGGPVLLLPARTLEHRPDGMYYLPFTREALEAYAGTTAVTADAAEETTIMAVPDFSGGDPAAAAAQAAATSSPAAAPPVATTVPPTTTVRPTTLANTVESVVVPLIGEEVDVQKHVVDTGVVRVHKTVALREETVDEPLLRQEVQVERVPINRIVEGGPPPVRHEGNTMIIPLLEEVLVVEKRLMLREELRVTRTQQEFHAPQQVTLRREEITVDRVPVAGGGDHDTLDPLPDSQIRQGQDYTPEQQRTAPLERQENA